LGTSDFPSEALGWTFEELAQNGVRRGPVSGSIGGARRTLCASVFSTSQLLTSQIPRGFQRRGPWLAFSARLLWSLTWFRHPFPADLLLPAFVLAVYGCNDSSSRGLDPVSAPNQTLRLPGIVEASRIVPLTSPARGTLLSVNCLEGAFVKKGQPLFEFDATLLVGRLNAAEKERARDATEAETVRANSRASHARAGESQPRNTAVAAAEATMQADQAEIDYLKLLIEDSTVRSPADGKIEDLRASPGDHVSTAGAPLASLRLLHPVYVTAIVPTKEHPGIETWIHNGTAVDCATDASGGGLSHGVVTEVERVSGTSALRLSAAFENPDNLLQPGRSVVVSIHPK